MAVDVVILNEEGYAPCPKCGYRGVNFGASYREEKGVAICRTNCSRCDYQLVDEVQLVWNETDNPPAMKLLEQRNRWNELSFKQATEDKERGYGLYRMADALRKEGERLIGQADIMQEEAQAIVGRHRNYGTRKTQEVMHGTE